MSNELYQKLVKIVSQLTDEQCDKLNAFINSIPKEEEKAVAK